MSGPGTPQELSWWCACLLGMKLWVPSPALCKPGGMVHTRNPSTQEVQAGGWEVQGHSPLDTKFKARLSYLYETVRK